MKYFICLNCGTLNSLSEELKCSHCHYFSDRKSLATLLKYSKQSVRYGYQYRITYENQLTKYGKLTAKYSLLEPTNYFDFLAAAVIAGFLGNLAYDIVKVTSKNILKSLRTKQKLTSSEKDLIRIISNKTRLKKFTRYISEYTSNNINSKKEIKDAINEEISADVSGKLYKALHEAVKSKSKMKSYLNKVKKEIDKKKQPPKIFKPKKKAIPKKRRSK